MLVEPKLSKFYCQQLEALITGLLISLDGAEKILYILSLVYLLCFNVRFYYYLFGLLSYLRVQVGAILSLVVQSLDSGIGGDLGILFLNN